MDPLVLNNSIDESFGVRYNPSFAGAPTRIQGPEVKTLRIPSSFAIHLLGGSSQEVITMVIVDPPR